VPNCTAAPYAAHALHTLHGTGGTPPLISPWVRVRAAPPPSHVWTKHACCPKGHALGTACAGATCALRALPSVHPPRAPIQCTHLETSTPDCAPDWARKLHVACVTRACPPLPCGLESSCRCHTSVGVRDKGCHFLHAKREQCCIRNANVGAVHECTCWRASGMAPLHDGQTHRRNSLGARSQS